MASNRLSAEELLKITNCKSCPFSHSIVTRPDIETLTKAFNDLAASINDKIDRSRFRDMLADQFGVDDSLIMDRGTCISISSAVVFRCFDLDADNYIGYDEFMKGMSVFLKGRYDEKLKFCFRVYDLNGDRYISKEEMYQMLKFCLVRGAEEDEDGIKDLVDLVLKKLDEDRDGRVSESDWAGAIAKESLLMEAFGQCLPNAREIERFLNPNADESNGNLSKSSLGLNNMGGYATYAAFKVPSRSRQPIKTTTATSVPVKTSVAV